MRKTCTYIHNTILQQTHEIHRAYEYTELHEHAQNMSRHTIEVGLVSVRSTLGLGCCFSGSVSGSSAVSSPGPSEESLEATDASSAALPGCRSWVGGK